jgi:hypothetical protein
MTVMEKLIQELSRDRRICFEKVSKVVDAVISLKNVGGELANLKFDKKLYKDLSLLLSDLMADDNFELNIDILERLMFDYCELTNTDYNNFDYSAFYTTMQGLKNQIDV